MVEHQEWSMSAVMKLVKEYEKRSELWDKNHPLYHSHETKNSAWNAVAQAFSCDGHDVRKKFRSVLASFRRERAKVREGTRSSWFLYPHLKFLPQYYALPDDDQGETEVLYEIEALEGSSVDTDGTHVSDDNLETTITIKEEPEVQAFTNEKFTTTSHTKKRLTRTIKKKPRRRNAMWSTKVTNSQYQIIQPKPQIRLNQVFRSNPTELPPSQSVQVDQETYSKEYVDSKILELQRMMKKDSLPRKDDCDTYGEYIACTLRKHDNKTQCRIKQAINNILFEEEMCKYEDPLKDSMQLQD